jgi:hypothetical protein
VKMTPATGRNKKWARGPFPEKPKSPTRGLVGTHPDPFQERRVLLRPGIVRGDCI